ncbi:F-box domain-containing protein [Caenorhabditis elegans]|uniref:F-box domain-containing protein n=1 Tax=Caenorhabditis elegans TaxID=6239 RepID=Q9XVV6_CAEEL|nr:F-box domain-containing protein [Caenorhabditis elegans]CAA94296.1 F-box domain-containing protein [Caenorhabditis elegans]|eukprot:NP_001255498.1 Uncharacterized protein CELE_K08C7.7 [Caenorhabditis elegans]
MNLENFPILELPPELILHVLKNYCYEELNDITVTCKTLHALIEENRNSLASKNIYHIDLERRRVRAWRDFSWCDRIPFRSFDYISKFFCNVNVKVLTVNKLDEEICGFLIEKAQKKMLRFEQLRLFHSFSASHESICQLLQASKCRGINFEAVESKLISKDLSLNGYRNLNSICFEMDDSIDGNFFASVLDISEARKFIFHACDNIPKEFVRIMFEKFLDGTREFDAVRITTNQNFSFDEIIADLNIQKLDNSTWKMKSTRGDEATITMRRNNFHFFVAFEVNDHRVEDILYKIPFIE